MEYKFWDSPHHGLIRQRSTNCFLSRPEIIEEYKWYPGNEYVMDAITGMGEDLHSCGEIAFEISREKALEYAEEDGVNLYDRTHFRVESRSYEYY